MRLIKRNPKGKSAKVLADEAGADIHPFVRFNYLTKQYEFVIQIVDLYTLEQFMLVGGQLEWEGIIKELHKAFEQAPA